MRTNLTLTALLAVAAIAAPGVRAADPPPPSQVIYLQQLPTPDALTKEAAAHGQTIARIEQSGGAIVVVYSLPNGQTNAVEYALLPGQPGAPAQAQVYSPAPDQVVPTPTTNTTTVYNTAPDYGYDYPYAYDYYPYPWGYGYGPWYPGIGIGFGYGRGYYGYGHYGHGGRVGGSFHGGGGFRGGAGFHGGGGHGGGGGHR